VWDSAVVNLIPHNQPEVNGDGYRLINRSFLVLKTKNGRRHEITVETLINARNPSGLHRASGGGLGMSKKYFVSIVSASIVERDAKLEEWLSSKPELKQL
jgi:hypothetical protein